MTAMAGKRSSENTGEGSSSVSAGRVGRAHGLDGSFYVTGARPRLLVVGGTVTVGGHTASVTRRAGTDEHPIVRLAGVEDRLAAQALRGLELAVELADAPQLEEDEWWATELEGCEVLDGERYIGIVSQLVELPSCEALEVRLCAPGGESSDGLLLVPMVRQAIRRVDVRERRIDVDMSFLGDVL